MRKKDYFAYQNLPNSCSIKTRIYLICKVSPFDKMFGNLRFIAIFDNFLLPNQSDLSAHCSYHFSTSEMRFLIRVRRLQRVFSIAAYPACKWQIKVWSTMESCLLGLRKTKFSLLWLELGTICMIQRVCEPSSVYWS